ncbi:hypothetical protein ACIGCM_01200 [Pseudomonas sp. NPDC078700]|uniref:hypothetical protein n=1 Tax=Pseudomonas sp. NPDC078700 TaxID=3364424 RepID=UPI0037C519E6
MHVVFAEPNNHTEGMTLTRETLNGVMRKQTTLKDAESSGDIKVKGDKGKPPDVFGGLLFYGVQKPRDAQVQQRLN